MSDAEIHARWHRALDEPGNEPEGPIRDHVDQIKHQAWRDGYNLRLSLQSPVVADAIRALDEWADGLEDAALQWLDTGDRDNYDRNNETARAARRHAEMIRAAIAADERGCG